MAPLPEHLRALYPFASRTVNVNGHAMHYVEEGKGPVLLCIHGNPTWSFYFRNLIKDFSKTFRVIAPDHIGMGLSEKPSPSCYPYTLERRVKDMEAFVSALKIAEPVTLIVHDWGGMIGTLFAQRNIEKIHSMIITNTAGFRKPQGKALPWRIRIGREMAAIGAPAILGMNLFSIGALYMAAKRPLSRAIRQGYLFPYNRPCNRKAQLAFVRDIPIHPQDPAFPLVKQAEENLPLLAPVPKLFLWGEKDFVFDTDYRDAWCRRFPDAVCHSYPEAGHYLFEDEKKETIAAIRDFLCAVYENQP